MRATILPFKPLDKVKKTNIVSSTGTPKRFDWITAPDMEELNEVDTRGRGYDYTDHCEEE